MGLLPSEQYFDSFINHEKRLAATPLSSFKLERVECLLKELGNPQECLKVIHIAGSKGKGSVAAIVASILKCAGYRAGLYTSPHIRHYRERIRVLETKPIPGAGEVGPDLFPDCISEKELCDVVDQGRPAVECVRARRDLGPLSFFEVYTALALYYFRKRHVDFAVLETGLGGRLDATNAARSVVAAITRISLEHTDILGDTLAKIAQEKAGIIKDRNQKVVIAPQDEVPHAVLQKRCALFGIKPFVVERGARHREVLRSFDGQIFDLVVGRNEYLGLELPLFGEHQRDNVATGFGVVHYLQEEGADVPDEAMRLGVRNVFWPGRLEIVRKGPLTILDSAHDPASAKALAKAMREIFGGKKVILVLGMSRDKDQEGIRAALETISKKVILTKSVHPRAADLDGAVDVATALKQAQQEAGPADTILIAGSIFVVSEARAIIRQGEKSSSAPVFQRSI